MAMKESGQNVAPLSQVKGGNQRLPEVMAATLESGVLLGKAAASIHRKLTPDQVLELKRRL